MRRYFLVFLALLALTATAAAAADLAPAPTPNASSEAAPARPPSPLAPPESSCLEWTDGCRVCQRPSGGEPACSNVGVACVQQATRCTRR